jgi:hypothetical protein
VTGQPTTLAGAAAGDAEAAKLYARKADLTRQLDLLLETRGPVAQLRRLVADLDAIADDLSQALREADGPAQRPGR